MAGIVEHGEQSVRIDVDAVFREKNPGLYRFLPRFFLRYIKRVIHQDDLNHILISLADKQGLEFISGALEIMGIRYNTIGTADIPAHGRFIFASNHPLGGLDGMVFINEVGKKFPDLKFPVNDLLLVIKNLEPVFLPINKHGSQAKESAQRIEEAYSSDAQILYFPAGLCSRKQSGRITDLEWKKHFIIRAIRHKRDIIPVHFSGRNSDFFYNLANLRKWLGIKSNIEMFYLPDEMFRQKGREITVRFGKPVPYSMFDRSKSPRQWADTVRDLVYSLEKAI